MIVVTHSWMKEMGEDTIELYHSLVLAMDPILEIRTTQPPFCSNIIIEVKEKWEQCEGLQRKSMEEKEISSNL